MAKNNALVNIERNKDTNVNITIGQVDELSFDNIRRNYDDVVMLEKEFSDRLEYSKEVLTKKLLSKQLQSDFEIIPRYIGNQVDFQTKAITLDAYEKFPIKINYTMQFKDAEEARRFRKNGLNELIEKAEETGKPVEIPNISSMKEFLGEYEDPAGYANKHGCEGIKLYVCPSPLPPAQKYRIDIFNSYASFNIVTSLRLKGRNKDRIILTNEESKEEPFNVEIFLTNMSKQEEISAKFNITISLREKFNNSCEYNKEIIKYKFVIGDSNNHIQISNVELGVNIFTFENCGNIKHNKKDYKRFDRLINLIEKVIYISKVKDLNINYDLEYFIKNEELIYLLYNECVGKKYSIKKSMTFSKELPMNSESEKFCNQEAKFNIISELCFVDLFETRIELKLNKLTMYNCSIIDVSKKEDKYNVKVESSNIKFELLK